MKLLSYFALSCALAGTGFAEMPSCYKSVNRVTWLVQNIDPKVRATVLSMSSQTNAIGQIAGGPGVGALGKASLRAAITASGLLLSPALPLYARALRHSRAEATALQEAAAAEV